MQQTTTLSYAAPDGTWDLPTSVQNAVGGTSSFMYDGTTGLLLQAKSPKNDALAVTHMTDYMMQPDYPESITVLQYNSDGLPSLIQDPLLHQISVGYNAAAAGSPNLVVTLTRMADGKTRQVTLDPLGRLLEAVDEAGVVTQWSYNPQGQVKTITRNATDPDPTKRRTTTFSYNPQGDLQYFDPPGGSSGRVWFYYTRLDQQGNPVYQTGMQTPIYEGQVTKIAYPDGTSELFGYNDAGELAWRKRGDGTIVTGA